MNQLAPPRRPWPQKLAFGLVLALLFMLAAEIGLRLIGFQFDRSLSYMEFNFPRPHELHQVFEPDPELLWKMRPGFEFGEGFPPLNSRGYRGPELDPPKPGKLRVACVGDSVVFGRAEADFPALLEAELKSEGFPARVMNFGVPGYSSWQGRKLLPGVLAEFQPAVVVIMFGWNDHWLAKGFPDKDQVAAPSRGGELLSPLRRLRVYQALNRALALVKKPPRLTPRPRVSPEDYAGNLAEMIRMTREAGALPVVVTAPSAISTGIVPDYLTYLEFIQKNEDLAPLHARYNDTARRAARDNGAVLADADLIFEAAGVTNLFADPSKDLIHPNQQGFRLLAETVGREISANADKLRLEP